MNQILIKFIENVVEFTNHEYYFTLGYRVSGPWNGLKKFSWRMDRRDFGPKVLARSEKPERSRVTLIVMEVRVYGLGEWSMRDFLSVFSPQRNINPKSRYFNQFCKSSSLFHKFFPMKIFKAKFIFKFVFRQKFRFFWRYYILIVASISFSFCQMTRPSNFLKR